MNIQLPDIDFDTDRDHIRRNRATIDAAIKLYEGAIATLRGLHRANAGMCKHPKKYAVNDPGYAGGGYSHSECPDCGARL